MRSQRWEARPLRETVSMATVAKSPVAALGGRPEEAGKLTAPVGTPGEAVSQCPGWHPAQTPGLLPGFPILALALADPADGLPAGTWVSPGTALIMQDKCPASCSLADRGAQNHEILGIKLQCPQPGREQPSSRAESVGVVTALPRAVMKMAHLVRPASLSPCATSGS